MTMCNDQLLKRSVLNLVMLGWVKLVMCRRKFAMNSCLWTVHDNLVLLGYVVLGYISVTYVQMAMHIVACAVDNKQ